MTKRDLDELRDDLEGECQGDYCEYKNGDMGATPFIDAKHVGWYNVGNCQACGAPVRESVMFNRKGHYDIEKRATAFGGDK